MAIRLPHAGVVNAGARSPLATGLRERVVDQAVKPPSVPPDAIGGAEVSGSWNRIQAP